MTTHSGFCRWLDFQHCQNKRPTCDTYRPNGKKKWPANADN